MHLDPLEGGPVCRVSHTVPVFSGSRPMISRVRRIARPMASASARPSGVDGRKATAPTSSVVRPPEEDPEDEAFWAALVLPEADPVAAASSPYMPSAFMTLSSPREGVFLWGLPKFGRMMLLMRRSLTGGVLRLRW